MSKLINLPVTSLVLSTNSATTSNALNTSFGQIINAGTFSTLGAKTGYRKIQGVLRINF